MEMLLGIACLFAFIALIAATSVYKEKESWWAFYVFSAVAIVLAAGRWLLHWW
jgi:hypothetical protein